MSCITSKTILPFGTQIHPVAKDVRPPRPEPSKYNSTYMKTTSTIKVPVPQGEMEWGTKPSWDKFNLPIAKRISLQPPAPELYNASYIRSPSTLKVPAPRPLTLEHTHSLFSVEEGKQATAGGPEQTAGGMGPMSLAQVMAEATKGTASHDFWVRALQLLTKIKLISLKRALTQVEKTELGNLILLIQKKATDLRPDIAVPPAIPDPLN